MYRIDSLDKSFINKVIISGGSPYFCRQVYADDKFFYMRGVLIVKHIEQKIPRVKIVLTRWKNPMDDNYNTIVHEVEHLVSVRYSVEVPLIVLPLSRLEKIYSYSNRDEVDDFFFRDKAEAEVLFEREVKNLKGTLTLDGISWEDTKSKLIETYMSCIIESNYFKIEYEKYKELPFFIKWFTPGPVMLTREEYKKIDSHPWEENYGDYLEKLRESLSKNKNEVQ